MNQSKVTLVLEIHVLTPRLVMLTFVRRPVVSMVIYISSLLFTYNLHSPEMFGFLLFSVCDEACREFVLDQSSGMLLCTISGHCFERWLCPDDEWDADDTVSPIQNKFSFIH